MDTERYDTILEYGKLYKTFKTTEMNIENESILEAARNKLIQDNAHELIVAIEKTIDYEQFGGSEKLLTFIKQTKSCILSATKSPKAVKRIMAKWEDLSPLELNHTDNKHCIENWTMATLANFTYEYLETLV